MKKKLIFKKIDFRVQYLLTGLSDVKQSGNLLFLNL